MSLPYILPSCQEAQRIAIKYRAHIMGLSTQKFCTFLVLSARKVPKVFPFSILTEYLYDTLARKVLKVELYNSKLARTRVTCSLQCIRSSYKSPYSHSKDRADVSSLIWLRGTREQRIVHKRLGNPDRSRRKRQEAAEPFGEPRWLIPRNAERR